MSRTVTCTSVGAYEGALTRGRMYTVLGEEQEKRQIKVRGDNGRARWFPASQFDLEGGPAPCLVSWQFDDPVPDESDGWVEVSLVLSDGTRRWCSVVTPIHLQHYLERPDAEPGVSGAHLVIVRRLSPDDVGRVLAGLDQQGELHDRSLPLDPAGSEAV